MTKYALHGMAAVFMLLVSACSQTPAVERPAQLLQADRLMERGHQAFYQGQLEAAARYFQRAETGYLAFDQRYAAQMAVLNRVQVLSYGAAADQPEQADPAQQAWQLLWPSLAEPSGAAQPVLIQIREQYTEAHQSTVVILSVRLLLQQDRLAQAEDLLDQLPAHQLEYALLRVQLLQAQQAPDQDITNALAQASQLATDATPLQYARKQRLQAQQLAAQDDFVAAIDEAGAALAIYRGVYNRPGMGATYTELSKYYQQLGDWQKAAEMAQRGHRIWPGQ